MDASWIDEGESARHMSGPLGLSLASHILLVCLLLFVHGQRPLGAASIPSWLGYKGKGQDARQLDLLQANALRFRIFQPAVGSAGSTGGALRTRVETPDPGETPQARARSAPTADGVRAPRRAPPASRSEVDDGRAATTSDDASGAPALQPDVALSEDLTIVKLVKPVYPERELAAGVSARVLVAIHVAPSGLIDELLVREAEANPPGSTRAFELTALEALRQWRVRLPPGDASAGGMWLTVPIEYSPTDSEFERMEDDVRPQPATSPTAG